MRYAVIPPEYLPGQETAALLAAVDCAVLADTYQYVRQSLQNRARLRTPDGTQWITIPLEGGQHGRTIRDVCMTPDGRWRGRHARAFRFNYGAAPYYEHYVGRITASWNAASGLLSEVTIATTRTVAALVGDGVVCRKASELPGAPSSLVEIVESVGSGRLVVPQHAWERGGSRIPGAMRFRFSAPRYRQQFPGFEPGCSSVDILFLHGPSTRGMLLEGVEIDD